MRYRGNLGEDEQRDNKQQIVTNTLSEEFDAYDSLPKPYRDVLKYAHVRYSSINMHELVALPRHKKIQVIFSIDDVDVRQRLLKAVAEDESLYNGHNRNEQTKDRHSA